jgi:hypothetical protein
MAAAEEPLHASLEIVQKVLPRYVLPGHGISRAMIAAMDHQMAGCL